MALYTIRNHEYLLDSLAEAIEKATNNTNEVKTKINHALVDARHLCFYLDVLNDKLPGYSEEQKRAYLEDAEIIVHHLDDILMEILY